MTRAALVVWRHPRPNGASGLCLGARSDPGVDHRRAKRLAHRIRGAARREGAAREIAVSPLRRCREVGRWLRRFGFRCVVDARLVELDFGEWDGRRWSDIDPAAIGQWAADLATQAPPGGETVRQLLQRAAAVLAAPSARWMVAHGGFISAASWLAARGEAAPTAADWPRAPGHGVASLLGTATAEGAGVSRRG
ncbi:MAG TPA: histidine phosphatase family protein [Methylibium sp.]|uniref:histidine phosphatase family protein n=1 Tax=Methylibium sp. TaxID=2067992 RepID=UPI002DB666DF|nr:histidine phosphatase family protein [Methylibium sp.]HEU4459901.1 histidine phosphatase family protein [Methylibium sp.]